MPELADCIIFGIVASCCGIVVMLGLYGTYCLVVSDPLSVQTARLETELDLFKEKLEVAQQNFKEKLEVAQQDFKEKLEVAQQDLKKEKQKSADLLAKWEHVNEGLKEAQVDGASKVSKEDALHLTIKLLTEELQEYKKERDSLKEIQVEEKRDIKRDMSRWNDMGYTVTVTFIIGTVLMFLGIFGSKVFVMIHKPSAKEHSFEEKYKMMMMAVENKKLKDENE